MDDSERMDEFEDDAIYQSSSIDLQDNLGNPEFKYMYSILMEDILKATLDNQRIFCGKMLESIEEIYDYRFPENSEFDTFGAINVCYEFIKFLEYDNVIFLSFVWQHLNAKLLNLDIESYCKRNADRIITEVEEQLESHEQSELISIFLRTYYKDKFIEWFIRETERSKTSILLEILEREGKLNV